MSEIQTPELQTLVSSNFRHAYVSENQTFGLDNRQRLYFEESKTLTIFGLICSFAAFKTNEKTKR